MPRPQDGLVPAPARELAGGGGHLGESPPGTTPLLFESSTELDNPCTLLPPAPAELRACPRALPAPCHLRASPAAPGPLGSEHWCWAGCGAALARVGSGHGSRSCLGSRSARWLPVLRLGGRQDTLCTAGTWHQVGGKARFRTGHGAGGMGDEDPAPAAAPASAPAPAPARSVATCSLPEAPWAQSVWPTKAVAAPGALRSGELLEEW